MAKKEARKPKFKLVILPRKQNIFGRFITKVSEMLGRVSQTVGFSGSTHSIYPSSPSIDFDKTNYTLMKALYFASECENPDSKTKEGAKYLLGAVFAKPIANVTAAFTLGAPPSADIEPQDKATGLSTKEETVKDELNLFIEKNRHKIFYWGRNAFRDGDAYIRLKSDNSLAFVDANWVDKIVDPVTGDLIGYDIKNIVAETDSKGKSVNVTYLEKLRMSTPFREVYKVIDGKEELMAKYTETSTDQKEIRPLPIIHHANEQEPNMIYGVSDYQSCLILFTHYASVLENAIKNNLYNSTATPIFEGVEDIPEFLATNFEVDEDGEYNIQWDQNKLMIGGKGFKANILQAPDSTEGAARLLNILFYLICQSSETPEYLMGTHVKSSEASVKEQTPIIVQKAQRKRGQLEEPVLELMKLYLWKLNFMGRTDVINPFKEEIDISIEWQPIISSDMTINIEIVKALTDISAIKKETAIMLLNPDNKIKNPEQEVIDAKAEADEAIAQSPLAKLGQERLQVEKNAATEMAEYDDREKQLISEVVKLKDVVKEALKG